MSSVGGCFSVSVSIVFCVGVSEPNISSLEATLHILIYSAVCLKRPTVCVCVCVCVSKTSPSHAHFRTFHMEQSQSTAV